MDATIDEYVVNVAGHEVLHDHVDAAAVHDILEQAQVLVFVTRTSMLVMDKFSVPTSNAYSTTTKILGRQSLGQGVTNSVCHAIYLLS
jgi:hypothetical protein